MVKSKEASSITVLYIDPLKQGLKQERKREKKER